MTALLVLVGALAGAPSRWLLDQAVQARHRGVFPAGTLAINVIGSFLLGALLAGPGPGSAAVWLGGTGFCGAFTTFSTFSYETVLLFERGAYRHAVVNVAASLVVGMAAAYAGWSLAGR